MILEAVKQAVDQFSLNELRDLRAYIEAREQQIETQPGTLDLDALLIALAEIRSGMSEEEFAEIERAMNQEYIEPLVIFTGTEARS